MTLFDVNPTTPTITVTKLPIITTTTSGSATTLAANSGSMIVASSSGKKIKIYNANFASYTTGLHYLYFGTTTGSTQLKKFCIYSGSGIISQEFSQPIVSDVEDAVYIISEVAETVAIPYTVSFIKE
jgi:hypothetical protein